MVADAGRAAPQTIHVGLVLVVLVAALALGWVLGGSLSRLAGLSLRSRRLVVAALLAQLGGAALGLAGWSGSAYAVPLAVSAVLVAAFLLRNRQVPGIPLIALGLLLNAIVVTANGAMPVSIDAAARANVSIVSLATGSDARHSIAGEGTRLRLLGDIVPVPLPLHPEVLSPGDVLVAAGIGLLVVVGMRRRTYRPGARRPVGP